MAVVRTLFVILEAAIALALIALILLQKSKSEGLGLAFGAGGNDSLFGANAGNVLTKATVVLGVAFLVVTLILGMMFSGHSDASLMDSAEPMQPAPVEQPVVPVQ